MKCYEFDAVIKKANEKDACFIEFPYDVQKEFGSKSQIKVIATFDEYEYRGSLIKMSNPLHCIGITKEIRKKINKQASDVVHVVIIKDGSVRTVELPKDFLKELNTNQKSKLFFSKLSYTNKKEYVRWILSAKKTETRKKRINDSIKMLSNEIKHP